MLFENTEEVLHIIPSLETKIIFLSLLFLILFFLLFFLTNFLINKYTLQHKKYLSVSIFIISLIFFQTIRDSFIHYDKIGTRQTKDIFSLIRASYNTLSVNNAILINNALGHKLYDDFLTPTPSPISTDKKREKINIIIYYGESMSSQYMSVFGYKNKTTPNLQKIKQTYNYSLFKEGVSGAIVTTVSTQRFFNLIRFPDARKQIRTSNTSLFKLAHNQGYQTAYMTTQAINYMGHIANKLGKQYFNYFNSPYDLDPNIYDYKDNAFDIKLLEMFNKRNFNNNQPQFLVLQGVGSHVPFKLRSPENYKQFGTTNVMRELENSIYYTDYVLNKLLQKIEKDFSGKKWLFFITSDHGTYVNGDIITRSIKFSQSYTVPMIFITNDKNTYNSYIKPLKNCQLLYHQQSAQIIAKVLGYKIKSSKCGEGIMMSTTAGVNMLKVTIKDDNVTFQHMNKKEVQKLEQTE
jgi:glucan phosphoethanolaminetransferase (alkaline phosphatase superfamily)